MGITFNGVVHEYPEVFSFPGQLNFQYNIMCRWSIHGGGQKLCTGRLVLPVADNILSECILPLFCLLLGLKLEIS